MDKLAAEIAISFQLNITDINEPPEFIKLSNTQIQERNFVGQTVAQIFTKDPEGKEVSILLIY